MTKTKKTARDKIFTKTQAKEITIMIKKILKINRKLTEITKEMVIADKPQIIKKIPQFKKFSFNLWALKI